MEINEALKLKEELEAEINKLLDDFTEETNLTIQDIDLDSRYEVGSCCPRFYQARLKITLGI